MFYMNYLRFNTQIIYLSYRASHKLSGRLGCVVARSHVININQSAPVSRLLLNVALRVWISVREIECFLGVVSGVSVLITLY